MPWFDDLKTPRIKASAGQRTSRVPDGMWEKCPGCSEILETRILKAHLRICPNCAYHFRLPVAERILMLSDRLVEKESESHADNQGVLSDISSTVFAEYAMDLFSNDPLKFSDLKSYKERLKTSFEKTGLCDACIVGKTTIEKLPYHLGVFEFQFMGGSMGAVVGEKLALLFENAIKDRLPAVIVAASGGARMQEGIIALMQMAKTSALVERLREEGIPFISVLTDPTTGGVAASFAMLGDVILAEPNALIGFAGPRVIQQTTRQTLPKGFQRSEFLLSHGFLDRIVSREKLALELREWMLRLGRNTCRFPKGI